MKLWRKDRPVSDDVQADRDAYTRLVQRAEYANTAARVVDTMHRNMSITTEEFETLLDVIRHEMETVARKLKDH
jgi:hypothetical protein